MMASKKTLPTAEYIRECLDYDPERGTLTWKVRPLSHFKATEGRTAIHMANHWNSRHAGVVTQHADSKGYLCVRFEGIMHRSHRLAWLITYGQWPRGIIDHINHDPTDNRIDNLREATFQQNRQNQKLSRSNKHGFKGVSWHRRAQKWLAQISVNNTHYHLGLHQTPEEAHAAYCNAARELHGDFWSAG